MNSKNENLITIVIILISIVGIGLGVLAGYWIVNEQTNQNSLPAAQLNEIINVEISQNQGQTNTQQANEQQGGSEQTNEQTVLIEPNFGEITEPTGQKNSETIATYYYYRQLNEYAKIIYDGLKENKEKLISGAHKIDYGTKFNTLLHTENGEKVLNEAFQSAWNAFSYDNVELFYIDVSKITLITKATTLGEITTYHVSLGAGNNTNYFQTPFQTTEQIEQERLAIENVRDQIVTLTAQDNEVTKIKKIHNWLVAQLSYDDSTVGKNKYTIYGPLREAKGVCEGYARSFKYLLDAVEIPCVLVSGTATNQANATENHAWNYVQLNNQWYAVDVTWDDPVITGGGALTDTYRYRYFLKGSQDFFKDHTEEEILSENSMKFKFPILSETNLSH